MTAQPDSVDQGNSVDRVTTDFMRAAIEEALAGLNEGGYPIGAVLVADGQLVARGRNRIVQLRDPTAHGEMDCLRNGGRLSYGGVNAVLYTTHSPCTMCSGAIIWFGIMKVVSGDNRTYNCSTDFLQAHGIEVVDLNLDECLDLISAFKDRYPERWQHDMDSLAGIS
jgi:cytosine deaminase